jgi:hypothetical protein
MPLGCEEITAQVGKCSVTLRPSLRACARLVHRYGDHGAILSALLAGNLSVCVDVIRECATDKIRTELILSEITDAGLATSLANLVEPLSSVILSMLGVDIDTSKEPEAKADTTAKPFSMSDYYQHLYKLGTGWCGWSPAETWAATPREILTAYNGRLDMLQAIFGSSDKQDDPESPLHHTPEDIARGREALRALQRGAR